MCLEISDWKAPEVLGNLLSIRAFVRMVRHAAVRSQLRKSSLTPSHKSFYTRTYRAGILASPEYLQAARCLREVPDGRVPRDLPINTEARPDVHSRRSGELDIGP